MEEALQFDNEGDYTLINGASVWITFPGTNLVVHLFQSDDEVHAEICDDRNEFEPLATCGAVWDDYTSAYQDARTHDAQ